ncbi:MAG: PKD domain-containing protein [Microthrixaceae bacterium]
MPEAWAIGGLVVELNVLDDDGATSSATTFVEVLAADGTPPTDPTDPTIPTDPSTTTVPGSPVARATVTPQSSTVAVLDASASTGDIASYQWTLGLLAGTATGQIANATFPGPGTYAVRLVVTDTQGRTGTWAGQAVLAGSGRRAGQRADRGVDPALGSPTGCAPLPGRPRVDEQRLRPVASQPGRRGQREPDLQPARRPCASGPAPARSPGSGSRRRPGEPSRGATTST